MNPILYSKQFGDSGEPVAILHGLFGSHTNWNRVAQSLQTDGFQVYTLDLRNHGNSFHNDSASLSDMANDFVQWAEHHTQGRIHLIGHSLGGQVAASVARLRPDLLKSLTVVDIAPKEYPPRHQNEIKALSIPLTGIKRRDEVEQKMAEIIQDPGVRQFLITNVVRSDDGGFRFRVNVKALSGRAIETAPDFPETKDSTLPSLWVYGTASDYVQPEDLKLIESKFPGAQTKAIPGAGHWLHYSHPEEFLSNVVGFLKSVE